MVLRLATAYGWLPSEVATMPTEWVWKLLEYETARDQVREVRRKPNK